MILDAKPSLDELYNALLEALKDDVPFVDCGDDYDYIVAHYYNLHVPKNSVDYFRSLPGFIDKNDYPDSVKRKKKEVGGLMNFRIFVNYTSDKCHFGND